MRINHNIAALNTHRQLGQANNANQQSMEKLSSGLRINRAGDDAAGLAISEKMRGQIRGLEQAERNAQDGISMIQTAEGALNETHSILQRMRELSVQASNDTNTGDDRAEIQKEINQLTSEVERIANDTEFNTKNLLSGSLGLTNGDSDTLGNVGMTADTQAATYAVDTTGVTLATEKDIVISTAGAATGDQVDATGSLVINGTSIETNAGESYDTLSSRINDANIGVTASYDAATDKFTVKTNDVGADAALSISSGVQNLDADATTDDDSADISTVTAGQNLQNFTASDITGGANAVTNISIEDNTVTVNDGSAKGLSFTVKQDGGSIDMTAGSALNLQIGANQGQEMSMTINDMSSSALGIDNLDVTSQSGASSAIEVINNAIQSVSSERSKLGAYQNRLDHTINNLGTSSENLTAAESRIRDVDMAKEMINQTKQNILAQASQSMLAKANQQPQGVLQLLR